MALYTQKKFKLNEEQMSSITNYNSISERMGKSKMIERDSQDPNFHNRRNSVHELAVVPALKINSMEVQDFYMGDHPG